MARTPITQPETPGDKRKQRESAQEDVLMREVDEAVRQDELSSFVDKYGKPLLAAIVLGLVAFGGYLVWNSSKEDAMEKQSETLVSALDQLQAGNLDTASATAAGLAAESEGGAKAAATMLQGGIAMQQNKLDEAAKIFASVAADADAPQTFRDLATIREIAASFDKMKPADIVARLKPLAVPDSPYFGSAGEMVAMAYLEQGKRKEAGDMFAQIAKSDDTPESLRSRARQMAGVLGVDAIDDVDEVLEGVSDGDPAAQAGGAPAAQ